MARSDWQYLTGSTNNNNVFFTGIRWRYRDDLFGTSGYPADRVSSNTDIIEYQPYVGKKSNYTSMYYSNWLTSYYKCSYNTISGSDPESASNQLNISTTFRFDKASTNTNYYLTKGNLSSGNVMNTNSSTTSRIIQVPHCSDGTSKLRLYFYFKGDSDTYFHYAETNQIVTLETIPRASSFTLSKTSGGDEASSFNLRESIYANITRASDTFTHRVYFVVGSSGNQLLSSSAATSANGTLSIDLANYILTPSSIATMYVDTYNGSTLIGSSSKTFTLVVPDDVKPTISSVTTSDTQDRLSVFGAYVQGKSTLRVQTSANGIYGSSIQSCTVQIKNGNNVLQTLSGTDVSLANISYTGNLTVSVTVTDSRGRTSSATTTSITVLEYFNPRINTFEAIRDNNTPTNVNVSINSDIASLNNNNNRGWNLKYKPTTSSSWTESSLTSSNYILNTVISLSNIDDNVGYDFQLVAADSFTTTSKAFDLGTSYDLINYKSDGTAIAFGKVSELSDTFECDLEARYYKNIRLGENNSAPWQLFKKTVDLSSLDQNTYYPVVSDWSIPRHGLHRIIEAVSLDSGTVPSWSTHNSGFSSLIDVLQVHPGWGTNDADTIILDEQYKHVNSGKVGWYEVLTQPSKSCFYLRGGGIYYLFSDWKTEWILHTSSYTYEYADTVAPTTTPRNSTGYKVAVKDSNGAFLGQQVIFSNNKTLQIGSANVSFAHYLTDANDGHYFNKSVFVSGNVFAGSNYNRMLAYQDEVGSEIGTSGIWNYIKYNNGLAICVGSKTINTKINNSWGGIYNSGDKILDDFPFTFTSVPSVSYSSVNSSGYSCFVANGNTSPSVTNPGTILLLRGPNTGTAYDYKITITAVGYWK